MLSKQTLRAIGLMAAEQLSAEVIGPLESIDQTNVLKTALNEQASCYAAAIYGHLYGQKYLLTMTGFHFSQVQLAQAAADKLISQAKQWLRLEQQQQRLQQIMNDIAIELDEFQDGYQWATYLADNSVIEIERSD